MQIDTYLDQQNLLDAITVRLASTKRALNTARNPKFRELYEQEFAEFHKLEQLVRNATVGEPELIKKK